MKKIFIMILILALACSCDCSKEKNKIKTTNNNIQVDTSLSPSKLATYVAESEATERETPNIEEIEKNGIKLVVIGYKEAVIKEVASLNILWKSGKDNELEIPEQGLSENGRYAFIQYGYGPDKVIFVETLTGKTHVYIPPRLPHSHDVWLTFEVTDEGLVKAIKNEMINGIKTRYEAYIYDFSTDKILKTTDLTAKTKGYIYFRTDIEDAEALDDVLHFAGNLQKNNILFAERIKVLEAKKGQKEYWLFVWDGKTKESGGTDVDVLYDAIDFFKINKKEYNL